MQCITCNRAFAITEDDAAFYAKIAPLLDGSQIKIPPPTRCPDCRLQRRLAHRAEYYYHSRKCTACKKSIVSLYSHEHPTPVYCHSCWWGDGWSAAQFGQEVDYSKPFFEQYRALQLRVPQLTLMNDNGVQSENCEYTNDFAYGRNCYLVTASWHIDGGMYATQCNHARDVVDSFFTGKESELAYECLYCTAVYSSTFLAHSSGCSNCHFGYDLRGCNDCVGCVGLRRAQYCILNQQLSKESYEAQVVALKLDTHSGQRAFTKKFEQFRLSQPHRAVHQERCEECVGEALIGCKNLSGFLVTEGQHSKNAFMGDQIQHCHDVLSTGLPQWCYEGNTPDESYQALFTIYCWKSKYILYSEHCHSSEYLFGCIGGKRMHHAILNRSYTAHEYEIVAKRLAGHMQETGEWGEFFPLEHTPFAYNESRAYDIFPLSKAEVERRGMSWRMIAKPATSTVTAAQSIPESIALVDDSILASTLRCEGCERAYKLIKLELAFYRKMKLPIPKLCPHCRRTARFERYPSNGKIFERSCSTCAAATHSTFSPDRAEKIVCERCYHAALV